MKKSILTCVLCSVFFCFSNVFAVDIIYNSPGASILVNTPLSVSNNLIIKKGTYLEVTSTISMADYSKIIIEKGAYFYLNGGTLTSTTNNTATIWDGIEVWGNDALTAVDLTSFKNKSYFLSFYANLNYGIFLSDNSATIGNSRWGIVSGSIFSNNPSSTYSGGIVDVYSTDFVNNIYSSIYYSKSIGKITNYFNKSEIHNCTFSHSLTSLFPGLGTGFYGQVVNKGGACLDLTSCTFTATNLSYNVIIGIISDIASSNISANFFQNYKSAIAIREENIANNNQTSSISNNTFTYPYNTTYPEILIANSDGIKISFNTFNCDNNYNSNTAYLPVVAIRESDRIHFTHNVLNTPSNTSDKSRGISWFDAGQFYGKVWGNSFTNFSENGLSWGKNTGVSFECNNYINTKEMDLNVFSGNVSPLQGLPTWPADNQFLSLPNLPSSRFNLNTYGSGYWYFYRSSSQVYIPATFTSPQISLTSTLNPYNSCFCYGCLIKPNNDDNNNDNTYGISSLGLSQNTQDGLVHLANIREKAKLVSYYLDSIKNLDSAIFVLQGDTSFFAIYTLSGLYLKKDMSSTALALLANSNSNGIQEFVDYKLLFPIIVSGISNQHNETWFQNNNSDLVTLSNQSGFVGAQSKGILDYFTNLINTENYTNSTISNFTFTCSPNPFGNSLNLSILNSNSSISAIVIKLFDRFGNVVSTSNETIGTSGSAQNVIVNTQSLSAGVYACVISSQSQVLKHSYIIKN